MGIFSRKPNQFDTTRETAEVAHLASGGALTAVASAFALAFSAVSLYETVLRQPDLSIYAPPVVHYTRELGREALLLPITIANRGARDGTVLAIEAIAKSANLPEAKTFYSAYTVESGYFLKSQLKRSPTGGLQIVKQRPKLPFSPLSIPGRSSYSATVLFFAKGKDVPRLVTAPGEFEVTIRLNTRIDDRQGWLDWFWTPENKSTKIRVELASFNRRAASHEIFEMKSADWK